MMIRLPLEVAEVRNSLQATSMTAAATLRDTLPVESVPEAGCARVVGASWQGVPCRNHKASDSCILTGTAEAVGVYAHCSVSREGLFGVGLAWDTMTAELAVVQNQLKRGQT